MIAFISAVETDLATARNARAHLPREFPEVRVFSSHELQDTTHLHESLKDADIVIVRILGGRAYFSEGFQALESLRKSAGLRVIAVPGDAHIDLDLDACSTAPLKVLRNVHAYAFAGGSENLAALFLYVANLELGLPFAYDPPIESPEWGFYHPDSLDRASSARLSFDAFTKQFWKGERGAIGIAFYRADWASGNLEHIDALIRECEREELNVLPIFVYSLRDCERIGDLPLPYAHAFGAGGIPRVDVILSLLSYATSDLSADERVVQSSGPALRADVWLDVPLIQAVTTMQSHETWMNSTAGLGPLDAATKIVMPEFDGKISGPLFAFRNPQTGLMRADPLQTQALVRLAVKYVRLRRLENHEKKIALVLTNFANRQGRVGGAVGLDTPASIIAILRALESDGYSVGTIPADGNALMSELLARGGYDVETLTDDQLAHGDAHFTSEQYDAWSREFNDGVRTEMQGAWGESPGEAYRDGNRVYVAGMRLGNVFVMIQPPRGFGENPLAVYHSGDLVPTHQYVGAYRWLRDEFGADAIIQCGKHGTLEWLPGKSLGLSTQCYPSLTQMDIPLFYPFIVDDPGEGAQAKRRAHACIIDHLIPPMTKAQTYDELAKLQRLLGEYAAAERIDPDKAPMIASAIWQSVVAANLQRDLNVEELPQGDDFGEFLQHVDGYLCELGDIQIRDGLHVLGAVPDGDRLIDLALALIRIDAPEGLGALHALALDLNVDYAAVADAAQGGKTYDGHLPGGLVADGTPGVTVRVVREALDSRIRNIVATAWDGDPRELGSTLSQFGCPRDGELSRTLRLLFDRILPNVRRCTDEMTNLLLGLRGKHVPPGPSGPPTRGMTNVLPTGRNFYAIDVRAVPSRFAWTVGVRLGDALLRNARERTGEFPRNIAITVWGTANMRTQGDDIAEILWLLGVRPIWHEENGRVIDLEVISLHELGRPRIDVTVRISGFFRDSFPGAVALLDRAVALVADLEEDAEQNYVRVAVLDAEAENRTLGMNADEAMRRARFRVFGNKPGSYGTGILELLTAGTWQDSSDLAAVYLASGSFAYGKTSYGEPAPAEFRARLAASSIVVQNQDNREHDIFDSDTYLQHHGGMIAAIRDLTGQAPNALFGDSSDPEQPKVRTLQEEAHRVFRARVTNPKWLDGMRRHGYKGALEMAATVDYLFGYDASAGVVEDWMYERVADSYIFEEKNRAFLQDSNPWAAREMTERLLEAAARGMWSEPDRETIERLREEMIALDGALEDRAEIMYAN